MIKDGLYHYVTGLPVVAFPLERIQLRYSRHALSETRDRYGIVNPPTMIEVSKAKLIEVEILNGTFTKAVLRTRYNAQCDLVLVIHPSDGFVRTLWLNTRTDNHKTLDKSKYRRP